LPAGGFAPPFPFGPLFPLSGMAPPARALCYGLRVVRTCWTHLSSCATTPVRAADLAAPAPSRERFRNARSGRSHPVRLLRAGDRLRRHHASPWVRPAAQAAPEASVRAGPMCCRGNEQDRRGGTIIGHRSAYQTPKAALSRHRPWMTGIWNGRYGELRRGIRRVMRRLAKPSANNTRPSQALDKSR
jgi:hypothetical protein